MTLIIRYFYTNLLSNIVNVRIPETKPTKCFTWGRARITILTANHDYSTILGNLHVNPNKHRKNKPV